LYEAPTCFDRIQNGNEHGIDCGGSCERLCPSAFLAPSVAWTSYEALAIGYYNAAAYIINPNPEGEALNVPYRIVLYDVNGEQIIDMPGTVDIPPHRNTLAFLGPIPVGKRVATKAFFEFTCGDRCMEYWRKKSDTLATLSIGEKNYTEEGSGSSLLVTLKNTVVKPIGRMSVYAILSDARSNIVGFSKTIVDGIAGLGVVQPAFTWPINRQGKVISIEVLPVAE